MEHVYLDDDVLSQLVFHIGSEYYKYYSTVLTFHELTDDTLIIEHEITSNPDFQKREFEEFMTNLGKWIGCDEKFDNVHVKKLEVNLPRVIVHLSLSE